MKQGSTQSPAPAFVAWYWPTMLELLSVGDGVPGNSFR